MSVTSNAALWTLGKPGRPSFLLASQHRDTWITAQHVTRANTVLLTLNTGKPGPLHLTDPLSGAIVTFAIVQPLAPPANPRRLHTASCLSGTLAGPISIGP